VRKTWQGYLDGGGYVRVAVVVGRCREDERGWGEKMRWGWGLSSASTQPISTPEKGDDENYDYENISAISMMIRGMTYRSR
jgi:hypothetical protein